MSKHQDILISHAETIERNKYANENCASLCITSNSINNSSNSSSCSITSKNENKNDMSNRQDVHVYGPAIKTGNVKETNKEQEMEKEISDSQYTEGTHVSVTCSSQSGKENATDDDDMSVNIHTEQDVSKKKNSIIFLDSCQNEKKEYSSKMEATVMNHNENGECSSSFIFPNSNQNIYSANNSINITNLLYGCNRKENEIDDSENIIPKGIFRMTQQMEAIKGSNDKKTKMEREIEKEEKITEKNLFEDVEDVTKIPQKKIEQQGNSVVNTKNKIDKVNLTEECLSPLLETIEQNVENEAILQRRNEMKMQFMEACETDTQKRKQNNLSSEKYEQLTEEALEQVENIEEKLIQDRSIEGAKEINNVVNYSGNSTNCINYRNLIDETNENMSLVNDTLNLTASEHIKENREDIKVQKSINIDATKQCEASVSKDKSFIDNSSVIVEEYGSVYKESNFIKHDNDTLRRHANRDIMENENMSIMKRKRKYTLNNINRRESVCRPKTSSVEQMSMNSLEKPDDVSSGNSVDCDNKSSSTSSNINGNDNSNNGNNKGNDNNNTNNDSVDISSVNVSNPISYAASPCRKSETLMDFEMSRLSKSDNINNSNNETFEKDLHPFNNSHTKNSNNFFISGKRGSSDESSFSNHATLSNITNSLSYDDLPNEEMGSDTTEKNTNNNFKLSCSEIEFLNNASAATNDAEKVMQWFDAIYTVCVRLDDLCCRLNSNFPHSMQMWENSNAPSASNLKNLIFNKDMNIKMDNTAEASCISEIIGNSRNNRSVHPLSELVDMNANKFNQNVNDNENGEENLSNMYINNGNRTNTDLTDAKLNNLSNKFYKNPNVKEIPYEKQNELDMFPLINEMNIPPTNVIKNNDDSIMLYNETFDKTDVVQQTNSSSNNNNSNCGYVTCENDKRLNVNNNHAMKNIYNEVNYRHVQDTINTMANNFFYHSNDIHQQNVNEIYMRKEGEHFNLKQDVQEHEGANEQNEALNDWDFLNMLHRQTTHMVMNERRYVPMVNTYNNTFNHNEAVDTSVTRNAKIPGRTRVRKNSKMSEVAKTEEKKTPRKKNSVSKKSNKTLKSESEFEYLLELSDKEGPSSENPDDLKCDVAGVYWDKRSWIASWYDNGKRYYKSFSAKTHGFYKSKFCAIKVRLSKVKGRTIFGKNVGSKRNTLNENNTNENVSNQVNTGDMQTYNANILEPHHKNILNDNNLKPKNNEN